MSTSLLFESGKIGSMIVKNRLVMPPMVRNYADARGLVTQRYVDHIERVARGGVGLMILEASYISPEGRGFVNELGLHDDAVIPGLKKLAMTAHKHGAKIGPQVYHAGRQTSSKTTGQSPVAPSALPDPTVNEMPEPLTKTQIHLLVRQYAEAASRAQQAGCDFVELHGAHGYLITQFLSPFSNRRTDEYGGNASKRMRFLSEVFGAVREAVGEHFPIVVRLSGDEMVEGGLSIEDTVVVAQTLERIGADALHISAGNYASYARGHMIPPMAIPDGVLVSLAKAVKRAVSIPVITVGKIRTPEMAQAILKRKDADFVAIGRTLLADPDWPIKVQEGREKEISRCIACNQGCISRLFEQKDVWCTVNPETGRERLFAKGLKRKKHIVVVGGGPAGMSAARTAAQKGHRVTLFEERSKLGGQLFAAAEAPFREGWNELREDMVADIKRLKVDVHLKTAFLAEHARKLKPDAVIIAIGSSAKVPNIPGIGRTNVVLAREVLERKKKAVGTVVIAGGGCMGAQTAEYLAAKGHKVTILEAGSTIAIEAPVDDRALLLGRLEKHGVTTLIETKMMGIGPKSVSTEGPKGTKTLQADTVVLCLGSFPNDSLPEEVRPFVKNVQVVGDALDARRVTEAVLEGALAVLKV